MLMKSVPPVVGGSVDQTAEHTVQHGVLRKYIGRQYVDENTRQDDRENRVECEFPSDEFEPDVDRDDI